MEIAKIMKRSSVERNVRAELLKLYQFHLTDRQWTVIRRLEKSTYKWRVIKLDVITPPMMDFLKHYLNYEVKRKTDGTWDKLKKNGIEYILLRKNSKKSEREIEIEAHMKLLVIGENLNKLTAEEWQVINELENRFIEKGNKWSRLSLKKLTPPLFDALAYYFHYEVKLNAKGKLEISNEGEIQIRKKFIRREKYQPREVLN